MEIKVSIVIPVYNVQKYLDECLESVCNQTLRELEIICVDDGSTDESGVILEQWACKDDRIRVIHKENGGYGKAMNLGMELARGEYIGIVEPDDYIELHMMERLYEVAVREDVDFVKSDFCTFAGEGDSRECQYNKLVPQDAVYEKVLKPNEDIDIFWGYVGNWTGIYKREFIINNGIKHNETPGASYQDQGFWFQVHTLADKVYLLPEAFYQYRQDNPNASMVSKQKVFCIADEYNYIYKVLSQKTKRFMDLLPIYIKCKYAAYLFNYNRVEERSKIIFLQRFAEEFKEHEEQKELDLQYFTEAEKRHLRIIMDTPELFAQILMNGIKVLNTILENKKITIYGAGKIAEQTWAALTDVNKKNVCNVWVTNAMENASEFHGVPILEAAQASLENVENGIIIIAVAFRYVDEIIEALREKGIEKYILAKEYLD